MGTAMIQQRNIDRLGRKLPRPWRRSDLRIWTCLTGNQCKSGERSCGAHRGSNRAKAAPASSKSYNAAYSLLAILLWEWVGLSSGDRPSWWNSMLEPTAASDLTNDLHSPALPQVPVKSP